MKTQIILKEIQYASHLERVLKEFREKHNPTVFQEWKLEMYLDAEGMYLIKEKIESQVYLEEKGFVTIDSKKIVDNGKNYEFYDLLIEKNENGIAIQKYIFYYELNREEGRKNYIKHLSKKVEKVFYENN